ncbi:hypothetical protein AMAG_20348 [Allomyces macrogynus ATCC 38327]|uniref:Sm protein B n=1 Tax=Allomyces macrogynus (strain ATCC 38327) TaxID=578462 RepID=A0A0L0T9H2_ALLM3|nr:hypothetical protein AMAG_20348 [Allomyces macrogynus ATCC 38327]|eukprot:KNE71397.1 hypothetical protein AMAG_20348 [Allomyces macrogynus ATCC 38327]
MPPQEQQQQPISTRRRPAADFVRAQRPSSSRPCRARPAVWWHRFAQVAASFVIAVPVSAAPLSPRSPQQPPPSSPASAVTPSSSSAAAALPPPNPASDMSPVMLLAMVAAGLLILSALFRLIRRISDAGDACPAPDTDEKNSKMLSLLNYRLRVTISDGRVMVGQMLAFDRHMNLVLADTQEFRRVTVKSTDGERREREEKRTLGLLVLRGETIVNFTIEAPPPSTKEAAKKSAGASDVHADAVIEIKDEGRWTEESH